MVAGLERDEELIALGSRNFFLCAKKVTAAESGSGSGATTSSPSSSCSNDVEKVAKTLGVSWLKFMDFLL